MLKIDIIASGKDYQNAAAWAAATYVHNLDHAGLVSVLLPDRARPLDILKAHSERFRFAIKTFPFSPVQEVKHAMQLKCHAFWNAVSQLSPHDLLFLVDADTCCCRPLTIGNEVKNVIFSGKIGLAPDVRDYHGDDPQQSWYIPREERNAYVNAGVILTSSKSLEMFALFLNLSKQPPFSNPPFGDQTIINFVLGKYYRDRLFLLSRDYNAIGSSCYLSPRKFIAHFAGAKEKVRKSMRLIRHQQLCGEMIKKRPKCGTAFMSC